MSCSLESIGKGWSFTKYKIRKGSARWGLAELVKTKHEKRCVGTDELKMLVIVCLLSPLSIKLLQFRDKFTDVFLAENRNLSVRPLFLDWHGFL